MTFKRLLGAAAAVLAVVLMTAPVGGAGAKIPTKTAVELSTNSAVKRYLRSLGISPRGIVIQRGSKNYAGPRCPGKGWTCTSARRVVQIASGGKSRAIGGLSLFATTQSSTNVASCSRLSGSSQSCLLVQSGGTGVSNSAQVTEVIGQAGQTLQGTQNAQVTQISADGANSVQLNQLIGQLSATSTSTVSQSQTSNQTFSISQTSNTGSESITVNQLSGQFERATFASAGTQYANGSLVGHFTQASSGPATAKISQVHAPTLTALGPNVHQTVLDPFRCCANQTSNATDTTNLTQSGFVKTKGDAAPLISALYEADCQSSGNCNVTETQNTNGTQSTNTTSGSSVNTSFNCAGTTCTKGVIAFDGSPGSAAPPATLGPYSMTAFGSDPQGLGQVSGVSDPAGTIAFTPSLSHTLVGQGWGTWSNGYLGDVYDTLASPGTPITITLPVGTKAFYLYAEPNVFAPFSIQATAQDGTTSGPITVQGYHGAQYFGFYGTGGATLASITVTSTDTSGFAVGEFGIAH
jgi:hypothetical protein